jgi:hypothetical protein
MNPIKFTIFVFICFCMAYGNLKAQTKSDSILAKHMNPIDTLHPKIGQFEMINLAYPFEEPYFYDQARLDSFSGITRIAHIINQNACLILEIGSFSDCRASIGHNDSITDARAKGIKSKLVNTYHCDGARLKTKGYGERQLLNNCSCEPNNVGPGKDCTEEEHRINRRTEIKIIGFL